MAAARRVETLARNVVALEAAETARRVLEVAGIPVIFLKGCGYLGSLYRDLSSRPMCDVDILIPESERHRARDVLLAGGFDTQPVPAGREYSFARHYNWPFVFRGAIPMLVEVHVGLAQPGRYPIDYDGIWARRVVREIDGRIVPTLCPEDALLHVILHDTKHWYATSGIRRNEDMHRLIECWQPDWAAVVERAKLWGIGVSAYISLQMAAETGIGVPRWVPQALAPSLPRKALVLALIDVRRGTPRVDTTTRLNQLAVTLATDSGWRLVRFLSTYTLKRCLDVVTS